MLYYHTLSDGSIRCDLCPHNCHLREGQTGICRVRKNESGEMVSLVYGHPCALAIDPVEKKPLAEFHPGTQCLSVACVGCNFRCKHCQNFEISQAPADSRESSKGIVTPSELVEVCERNHCPGIAYTYTEPLTWYEYTYDTSVLAHEHGLWNILVTAGYTNPEPAQKMAAVTDAANIDLKYFSDELYEKNSGGHLQPVLDTIQIFHEAGVHVELTNLVIPTLNDDEQMVRQMCRWLVDHDMASTPLHFTRFFPMYRLKDLPPTPVSTLRRCRKIAEEEGLTHIYLGNI